VLEVNDKFAWLQCQKKAGIEAQATLAEEEQATLAKSLVQVCRVYLFIIKWVLLGTLTRPESKKWTRNLLRKQCIVTESVLCVLTQKLQSTLQPAEVLTFLEASATKSQLELSCHSLRCRNYPFYTWSLDSV